MHLALPGLLVIYRNAPSEHGSLEVAKKFLEGAIHELQADLERTHGATADVVCAGGC